MKKIYSTSLFIAVLGVLLFSPAQAFAAGGVSSVLKLTSSASSATVGNKVTVYLYAYQYACDEGATTSINTVSFTCTNGSQSYERAKANDYFWISVTGSNNTITGLTTQDGHDAIKTGSDGKGQFTISSTKAETKKVTVTNYNNFNPELNKTLNITFKAAAVAAAPVVVAPDPPKATLEIQGKTPTEETITLRNKEPLVLKGTTVANATVKLYIFSDPKQETVTADASGNWAYTVSGLEPGDHHVEAEVTDPATGKTSARATLATFSVAQPAKASEAQKVDAASPVGAWLLLAGEAVAVIAVAGGAWWWFVMRKKAAAAKLTPKLPTGTPDPSQTNQ